MFHFTQVTAPSLHDPRCQDALTSALVRARTAAADLVSCTDPHLQDQSELRDLLLQKQGQLEDSLEKIAQAMHVGQQGKERYWLLEGGGGTSYTNSFTHFFPDSTIIHNRNKIKSFLDFCDKHNRVLP